MGPGSAVPRWASRSSSALRNSSPHAVQGAKLLKKNCPFTSEAKRPSQLFLKCQEVLEPSQKSETLSNPVKNCHLVKKIHTQRHLLRQSRARKQAVSAMTRSCDSGQRSSFRLRLVRVSTWVVKSLNRGRKVRNQNQSRARKQAVSAST